MSAETIFTRRPAGLDYGVWLTAIIAAILALGLLGFKIAGSNVTCHTVMITIKPAAGQPEDIYYVGEKLSFQSQMANTKTVEWDFGDGSPKASGASAVHAFMTEGAYVVTTTVNGKCSESVNITIRQLTNAPIATTGSDSVIFGPDAPIAGEPVRYTAGGTAQGYEWTVLNAPDFPVQREPSAIYIFPAPGTRVIEVKLDGDPAKTYRKTITILPSNKAAEAPVRDPTAPPPVAPVPTVKEAPAAPVVEGPKVLIIPDEEFTAMLEAVKEGHKDVSSFSSVLCNGAQTKVLENGEAWTTFGEFCSKIHDNKKYIIRSVQSVRNEQNCVTLLKVRYKKKGLLGL
jgi:PKD repeat protein